MALVFDHPVHDGPIRQGEVLQNIWEYRALRPPIEPEEDMEIEIDSQFHKYVVAMTPDCDLHQDFAARFPDDIGFTLEGMEDKFRANPDRYTLTHILLCDALEEQEFRITISGSDIWRRVRQNQDERYHHLGPAPVGAEAPETILDIYLDFKKVFALALDVTYSGIRAAAEQRVAVIPPVFLHDLVHRFYNFHSRVGLPE